MATFDTSHETDKVSFYKFYVINHTSSAGLYYDLEQTRNNRITKLISGNGKGIIPPKDKVVYNFDLYEGVPAIVDPAADIAAGLLKSTTIEIGSVSLFNVNNTPISLRFWSGGVNEQYINFINDGPVKVTRDEEKFNEVKFNQYRLTLDAGGHNNDTLDIFFQLYDA